MIKRLCLGAEVMATPSGYRFSFSPSPIVIEVGPKDLQAMVRATDFNNAVGQDWAVVKERVLNAAKGDA
jgi:hypothetical protein